MACLSSISLTVQKHVKKTGRKVGSLLLKSYTREIFRPTCNSSFKSLHCIASLDQDVSAVLPYLNTVLGGFEFTCDPPAMTFFSMGRLITVHSGKIAIAGKPLTY